MDINIPKPPILRILDDHQKTLLTIGISTDGKLKVEYDPDDLDEAAKIFISALKAMSNPE